MYKLQSKKLDPKTISGYFIGYYMGSRSSRFYYPSHTTRVIKSDRAFYFEDDTGTRQGLIEIAFKEHLVFIPMPIASAPITGPVVDQHLIVTPDNEPIEEVDQEVIDVVMDIPLRRSERA